MSGEDTIILLVALGCGGLIALVMTLATGRGRKLDARLQRLDSTRPDEPAIDREAVARLAKRALPRVGTHLIPGDEQQRTKLQARLIHAGYYGRQAMGVFLGIKMLLMAGPIAAGILLAIVGVCDPSKGILFGTYASALGLFGPGRFLDRLKKKRQVAMNRGLPDALDVLVICLEGGLTLSAALARVAGGLRTVHPVLSAEIEIALREIQLGRGTGEVLRNMGDRADLEEIRSIASVVIQSERFGASLAKALRLHAESLRIRRQQHAEAMAQKAGTKVMIPTLLFIFPAVFVVILGPAMIQISESMMKSP